MLIDLNCRYVYFGWAAGLCPCEDNFIPGAHHLRDSGCAQRV